MNRVYPMARMRDALIYEHRFKCGFYTKKISSAKWELAGYTIRRKPKGLYMVEGINKWADERSYVTLNSACKMVRHIYTELWFTVNQIEDERRV